MLFYLQNIEGDYMKKIKYWLCDEKKILGKFFNLLGMGTEQIIDLQEWLNNGYCKFSFFCPCCMFWRGIVLGMLAGMLIGWII